jgi:tRNA threonylcarbamoyladenosine biosynthesis protein TsaB
VKLIVIDTADSRGAVALVENGSISVAEGHSGEGEYSGWLLQAVRMILAQQTLSLAELDGYAVCAGPGSFTGLRVGLTTVKAWSEIYGKPIVALSRLEALALATLSDTQPAEYVAACIDARRDQCFAALYRFAGKGLETVLEESVLAPAEFLDQAMHSAGQDPVVWRTPDPALLLRSPSWSVAQARGHVLEVAETPLVDRLGALAFRKFQQGAIVDSLALDANYVRRSDAELYWKGNTSALNPALKR